MSSPLYGILFRAAAETLRTIAADSKHLGAEIGFFAVLHTWGSNLLHHPHLHCVVSGGGLSTDGMEWVSCRAGFFLPVRVLSRLFRRLFLEYLIKAFEAGKVEFFSSLESLRDRSKFLDYLAGCDDQGGFGWCARRYRLPIDGRRMRAAYHEIVIDATIPGSGLSGERWS